MIWNSCLAEKMSSKILPLILGCFSCAWFCTFLWKDNTLREQSRVGRNVRIFGCFSHFMRCLCALFQNLKLWKPKGKTPKNETRNVGTRFRRVTLEQNSKFRAKCFLSNPQERPNLFFAPNCFEQWEKIQRLFFWISQKVIFLARIVWVFLYQQLNLKNTAHILTHSKVTNVWNKSTFWKIGDLYVSAAFVDKPTPYCSCTASQKTYRLVHCSLFFSPQVVRQRDHTALTIDALRGIKFLACAPNNHHDTPPPHALLKNNLKTNDFLGLKIIVSLVFLRPSESVHKVEFSLNWSN